MPRKPNTPCLSCGKLCWPTYKRKGEPHACADCRRRGFRAPVKVRRRSQFAKEAS